MKAEQRTTRHLVMPIVASGVLMAAYLLLRPYGDAGGGRQAAESMATQAWVVAHVCGMLALAQYARAALRLSEVVDTAWALVARRAALAGLVLVLPYYGAETFALHVIARRWLDTGDDSVSGLVDVVREQPVALSMFGLGLVLLAVGGLCLAVAWQRAGVGVRWAAWPLGVLVALLLPQFYLPAPGRMAYGVAYLIAAGVLAGAAFRVSGRGLTRLGGDSLPIQPCVDGARPDRARA